MEKGKGMTKEALVAWCGDWMNCYWVWIDGKELTTGECPPLCGEVAVMVGRSEVLEDVTDRAEEYGGQMLWEADHNGCRLYSVKDGKREVVVAYWGHYFH